MPTFSHYFRSGAPAFWSKRWRGGKMVGFGALGADLRRSISQNGERVGGQVVGSTNDWQHWKRPVFAKRPGGDRRERTGGDRPFHERNERWASIVGSPPPLGKMSSAGGRGAALPEAAANLCSTHYPYHPPKTHLRPLAGARPPPKKYGQRVCGGAAPTRWWRTFALH